MKRKLFVALIAVAVISAIVGTCFAVYAKDATPKSVVLTTGDAVTLGITATSNFSLTELSPSTNKTLPVTLTASNVDDAEDGIQGKFTVTIAAKTEAAADVALAAAINVSAAGTHNDESAYAADKAALAAGDLIDLDNIPTTLTLTFSISEEAFLAGAAEGQVTVTLTWEIVDNWAPDANKYYVIGSMTGWEGTKDSTILSTEGDLGGNDAVITNVHFNAGDEFKIKKGDSWYSINGEYGVCTGVTANGDGNAVVGTAGYYNIYLKTAEGFFVSPYVAP